ncbi:DNA-binding response OmpR family regulator [Novosphingobium chloroacetimidivorans]|uniref:DNA-binding response OmpR family regulator n=1 Tax=Novosphingobium chloroacetimidivorans TaxID=1428314 RepID=A0A7W7KBN6_9SPHN|nr:response regulator [Novosphingobium chloroacetimidivorans]MBB4859862.1 DNA-binding response OmpR family regulator [Novosphingobium chloroacetimidivorans]
MSERKRVLVVDDEMLVAMMLEDMLDDLGYQVVGPAGSLKQAMDLAESETLDCAILDLNLGQGVVSTPVAELLRARGVPFLLATGYGANAETDRLGHAGLLPKPFSTSDVEAALKSMLG